jgi:hypothetical protein
MHGEYKVKHNDCLITLNTNGWRKIRRSPSISTLQEKETHVNHVTDGNEAREVRWQGKERQVEENKFEMLAVIYYMYRIKYNQNVSTGCEVLWSE